MIVVLVGAQLNAEIEQQAARDPAGERVKRGALGADPIGASKGSAPA
jgi:hypothetical protein